MTHYYGTLGDSFYFWFGSNDTSGSGNDGASAAADVRLAGDDVSAAPVLSPSPGLLTHINYPAGCYEVAVAAAEGNGFAAGNTYAVFATLAVDSQNPTGFIGSFTLAPVIANVATIEDGAITAAAFDQSTAYPLASADTGATAIARTGADTDTLETLSDQLDAAQADLDNPGQYKADVSALALQASVDDLEGRLSATRAGYLDNLSAGAAALEATVQSILADTSTDGVVVAAGSKTGYGLTAGERNSISDAILTRDWSAVVGAASRCLLNAGRFLRNKWTVSDTTLTIYQEDDETPAWTAELDTDVGAIPVTGVDPE